MTGGPAYFYGSFVLKIRTEENFLRIQLIKWNWVEKYGGE